MRWRVERRAVLREVLLSAIRRRCDALRVGCGNVVAHAMAATLIAAAWLACRLYDLLPNKSDGRPSNADEIGWPK